MIVTTAARLAALSRQLDQLVRMNAARAHTPEATAVTRAAFEANWRRMFAEWTDGYSELERDAEAERWLALMEAAV